MVLNQWCFFFVCFVLFSQRQMTVCLLALCHNAEPFIVSNEKVNCSPFATANIDRALTWKSIWLFSSVFRIWRRSWLQNNHHFFRCLFANKVKHWLNCIWPSAIAKMKLLLVSFAFRISIEFKHLNREIGRENVCASKSWFAAQPCMQKALTVLLALEVCFLLCIRWKRRVYGDLSVFFLCDRICDGSTVNYSIDTQHRSSNGHSYQLLPIWRIYRKHISEQHKITSTFTAIDSTGLINH